MEQETHSVPTFDPDEDIVSYDEIDVDDCYLLRREAELCTAPRMAARVEIERRNLFDHDDYAVTFAKHELIQIGVLLMQARDRRQQRGEMSSVAAIESLSETFLDGLDLDDDPRPDDMIEQPDGGDAE